MSNIINIGGSVNKELVDTLEHLLEGAKAGRVQHMAAVSLGDVIDYHLALDWDYDLILIGGLEALKGIILESADD